MLISRLKQELFRSSTIMISYTYHPNILSLLMSSSMLNLKMLMVNFICKG